MSILDRLASARGIRGDVPNRELATELAERERTGDISEIAENLGNPDKAVQSDCIKVLYEIGYLKPELIAGYCGEFLDLLKSRNNRLVWGSMTALSTLGAIDADRLFESKDVIIDAVEKGSVITVDAGIKTLAGIASADREYNAALFPYLIRCLAECRPKSVAQYAESIIVAVNDGNREGFIETVENRRDHLTDSQWKRIKRLLKK